MKDKIKLLETLKKELKIKQCEINKLEREIDDLFLASRKWLPWEKLKDYANKSISNITYVVQWEDSTLHSEYEYCEECFSITNDGSIDQSSLSGGCTCISPDGEYERYFWGKGITSKNKYIGFYNLELEDCDSDEENRCKETYMEYLMNL